MALTAARRRLGERPSSRRSSGSQGQLMPSRDPWARVGGLLVTAWDGTTLKVPATPENIAALGPSCHAGGRKAPAGGKDGKAIRALICHAAAGTDPGRLSFTTALNAARRTLASRRHPGHRRERDPRKPPPRPAAPHLRPRPPSPTPPAPTPQGTASPSHYHRPPTTPSPSRHQEQPPGNIMTSSNTPPTRRLRPLKLLALRLSRRFYRPSLRNQPNTADLRIGCSRLCPGRTWSAICPCAGSPGRRESRTGTDRAGRSGKSTVTRAPAPLTSIFKPLTSCRH